MKYLSLWNRVSGDWFAPSDLVANIARTLNRASIGDIMPGIGKEHRDGLLGVEDGIAIIDINGAIGRGLSSLEMACGGVDVDSIRAAFDAAESDTNIRAIAFRINCVGGAVAGIPELAQHIRDGEKPSFAWTGTVATSGGQYIASACDVFACAPSATVGSVGVIRAWIDHSRRMANDGDDWIVIQSGTEKATGIDGKTTDVAFEEMQKESNILHADFKKFVNFKNNVDDMYLQGMAYSGRRGFEIGLADMLVDTFEQLLTEVIK